MPTLAYDLIYPDRRDTAVVFASPHSGRDYSEAFRARARLQGVALRSSEDAFVDRLFEHAPKAGAPLLRAGAPRAYVDLNRGPDELDPALIEGVGKRGHNPRVASGLGVIPRVVSGGRAIYDGKLGLEEARARIDTFWRPYHAALARLLDQAHGQFGSAILIDCHSMPHEAMDAVARAGAGRPDVVLGDRFGAAAGALIVDRIEAAFRKAGLTVARNAPFAGAYITQTYGRPLRNRHAVQIEIDRGLYMDEATVRPNAGFKPLQSLLATVIEEVTDIGRPAMRSLAAE